ncbi:hypothetical protein ceV_506 [Chrysochromulina ericina virus CeV-01B]|uniref:SMODS and SLOG-associating 2TM effector domain-containing protein n=1 Tax=Chrysochromulina ericina virus CeV-01B TaxID=3070830 RepID=A0A0N9Q9T6_9VIRU|nr:hypothetical protein ceV_506 [Chrysochromulina ericina virus]ALH23412.1 hypothetical protein ceV_506 [Chrysochromulina ericina virus CeV-01B]
MSINSLNNGEAEALANARLGDIRKKVNAESWSDNMEILMKQWGEKAAGLRFMHGHAGSQWKGFANKLAITGIVVTGVASTLSLVATSIDDTGVKDGILFGVGGIGLVSTLVQSFKKFYNAEEKAADHGSVSKQFGSFYRYMTLQLGMSREDRDPADVLTTWALKEYERLQQEAPNLGGGSVALFKKTFTNENQAIPDVAEDEFVIKVYRPMDTLEVPIVNIKLPNRDVTLESTSCENV